MPKLKNIDISALKALIEKGPSESNFSIIDETEDFVVVLKKHGIAVQATDNEKYDLETILNIKYNQNIFVLNRIDQPVTGIVIFGKNKEFANEFTEMLKDRTVKKLILP